MLPAKNLFGSATPIGRGLVEIRPGVVEQRHDGRLSVGGGQAQSGVAIGILFSLRATRREFAQLSRAMWGTRAVGPAVESCGARQFGPSGGDWVRTHSAGSNAAFPLSQTRPDWDWQFGLPRNGQRWLILGVNVWSIGLPVPGRSCLGTHCFLRPD